MDNIKRAKRKIKKGDTVIVICGKDKGRQGVVMVVLGDKIVVEGINVVKRHTKPNPNAEQPGGILSQEKPIAISNVALFNHATGKGDRIGFKVLEDGRKVRFFKSTGEVVDA